MDVDTMLLRLQSLATDHGLGAEEVKFFDELISPETYSVNKLRWDPDNNCVILQTTVDGV